MEALEYLAESLVFCLKEPVFTNVGNEILQKLYMNYPEKALTPFLEKSLLKNQSLYLSFKEWLHKERPAKPGYELLESPRESLKIDFERKVEPMESSKVVTEDLLDLFESVNAPLAVIEDVDYKRKCKELDEKNEELEKRLEKANFEYLNSVGHNEELSAKLKETEKQLKALSFSKENMENIENKIGFLDDSIDFNDEELRNLVQSKEKTNSFTEVNIKNLQETILCLEEGTDFVDSFLRFYEKNFTEFEKKKNLISELKLSIVSARLLNNLNTTIYKILLNLILRICCCDNTQKEINTNPGVLEKELQIILDALLKAKNPHKSLIVLISILNKSLPIDFSRPLNKENKLFYRLIMKCMDKVCTNTTKKGFKVVLEIYKLFKRHPPEKLTEDLANLSEYEAIYKGLKKICDGVLRGEPEEIRDLVEIVKGKGGVFIDYVQSVLNNLKKQ